MKMKEESEKAGLNLNFQKSSIMATAPITSWQIEGEKVETEWFSVVQWLNSLCYFPQLE